MARYATWRKHREQRAHAVQQAIFMPTKRGSRAIARYARVSEATCACVCMPGPSSLKEWLSSRPIDRLESKITRFLATHSQARLRAIVPDGASCRGISSLLSFLSSSFFFVKAKAAARCNKPVLLFRALRSSYVPRCSPLLYARRNINAGLILVSLWSPIFWTSMGECLCLIAGRLTRKHFRRWITVIHNI